MSELYRDFIDRKADEIITDLGGAITPAPPNEELYRDFLERKFNDVINALPSSPSGGHHYSTIEHVVGTWIDGTSVYEKTQYIPSLPSADYAGNWINYPHGIINFNRLISVSATAYNSNIPQQLNIPHVNAMSIKPTMVGQIAISVSDTNIAFIVGQDRSSWEAYVTIQYTKFLT